MADACTCHKTRDMRAALAERLGIKHRKQWEIRRGSADSPQGESVTSVSFLIALACLVVLFIGSIIAARRARGSVRTLGIIVASVTGAYLAWISVLLAWMRIVVGVLKRVIKKA
jgi:hypothetical protein